MKKIITSVIFFGAIILSVRAQTIPTNFFGMNYWMPLQIPITGTNNLPGGAVNNLNMQTLVHDAGTMAYRIGGNNYDANGTANLTTSSDNDYIAAMVNVLAANPNASFLVQVPYKNWGAWSTTNEGKVQTLVTNVENYRNGLTPKPNVYYAIGNEYDAYSPKPTCSTIAADIKAYAISMKKVETYNIKIVGPSVTNFWASDLNNINILQSLIGGGNDITGIIPTGNGNAIGRPYIDVVDYHSYPGGCNGDMSGTGTCVTCPHDPSNNNIGCFNSTTYSQYRSRSIDYPNGGSSFTGCSAGYSGQCSFKDELSNGTLVGSVKGMQKLIADANTLNNRTSLGYPLTFALTEMNIASKNPPNPGGTNPEDNSVIGLGPRSFFAGQYWLSMFSSILQNIGGISEFVMPWSIHEHGGDGISDANGSDLGMTKGTASSSITPAQLSTYWHYQMMAKNFSGSGTVFKPDLLQNNSLYKAFACTTSTEIKVLLMNQTIGSSPTRATDTHTKTFIINFKGATPTTGYDMSFSFAAAPTDEGPTEYNCTITVETTMLLVFDAYTGALKKRETYSLRDALRTTDTGTFTDINNTSEYGTYSNPTPYNSDIIIGTNSSTTITAGANQTFTGTNSVLLNGPYSSNSKTLLLQTDHTTCYSNP